MKTPPNDANAVMRGLLRDTKLGTVCTAGLTRRAEAWSRGPAQRGTGARLRGCDRGAGHGAWCRPMRVSGGPAQRGAGAPLAGMRQWSRTSTSTLASRTSPRSDPRGNPLPRSDVPSIAHIAMEPAPPCNAPACGDATVQARMRTALKSGAPCPAPGPHPSAKADGASEGGRGAPSGDLTPATRAGAATTRLDQLHGRIPTSGAPAPALRAAPPCSALRGYLAGPRKSLAIIASPS